MTLKQWLSQWNLQVNSISLIENAFVHSSFVNETKKPISDNERLEFIGDAVLQLWTADFLYKQTPMLAEGQMTLIRSQLVNEDALANFARKLSLSAHLKLGVGEQKSGGSNRDSILADCFEALVGALYLDGHLENVNIIFEETIVKHYRQIDIIDVMDYKTKLQELLQSDVRKTVTYVVINSWGPSNNPIFETEVKMDGLVLGVGKGSSKKKSQQAAARNALEKLVK